MKNLYLSKLRCHETQPDFKNSLNGGSLTIKNDLLKTELSRHVFLLYESSKRWTETCLNYV